jgi:GTPase SAR1 family protein
VALELIKDLRHCLDPQPKKTVGGYDFTRDKKKKEREKEERGRHNNHSMALFARLHASIFGSSGPEIKIAIIGLGGVGKNTLLQLINEDQIQTICHPNSSYLYYKTGKNYHLRMNYVMAYVGYDEPGMNKIWLGEKFCDSDGIIFVIDDDHDSRPEAAEWMEAYVKGFRRERWPDHFPNVKVREGIPWLVLANPKKNDVWPI